MQAYIKRNIIKKFLEKMFKKLSSNTTDNIFGLTSEKEIRLFEIYLLHFLLWKM